MDVKSEVAVEQSSSAATTLPTSNHLYASVLTFDAQTGKTIGERIVDMYHFGTNAWIAKHSFWAMKNGHTFEVNPATDEEVGSYLARQEIALAAKYNKRVA